MGEARALPRHVAIIMDGNGRWAKKHRLATALGHRSGVEALREIVRYSSDAGIQVLSLYAFSTENWSRSPVEVNALMGLIVDFFLSEIDELHQRGVRIRILGDVCGLPEAPRAAVMDAQARTQDNRGLQLNIALNYGARDEIIRAVRAVAHQFAAGDLKTEDISAEIFEQNLYTAGQSDVDLLIRTSGEMRLSNFLLWQCAYAEFLFPEKLWPDYTVEDFQQALEMYARRERRFGGRTA